MTYPFLLSLCALVLLDVCLERLYQRAFLKEDRDPFWHTFWVCLMALLLRGVTIFAVLTTMLSVWAGQWLTPELDPVSEVRVVVLFLMWMVLMIPADIRRITKDKRAVLAAAIRAAFPGRF